MQKDVWVLDGDGVIFDYRKAFPGVWRAAFGSDIEMVRPDAYHAHTAYGIEWESETQMKHFFSHFGEEAWSTMPLMEGAKEGCHILAESGVELVIVSSMNPAFENARMANCLLYELPIDKVFAVKRGSEGNPKLDVIEGLRPRGLADDLADNFEGLSESIHRALIDYKRFDSPNIDTPHSIHSRHGSLLEFARYWVNQPK